MYEYKCEIVRVVDGDTVDVNIDLGFNTWLWNCLLYTSPSPRDQM